MGSLVFWILFWVLVIVAVIIGFRNNKEKKNNRILKIRESFGTYTREKSHLSCDFSRIKGLLEYEKEYSSTDFFTEDSNFCDLNLDSFFDLFNRCFSTPGEEYLYYKLKSLNQDPLQSSYEREVIDNLLNDEDLRIKCAICLDELGKLKNHDAFSLISSLREAKSENNFKHILFDILFLLSIGVIFISPGIGFIFLLVMLFINISTYFSGRRKMEEGIFGFGYSLRLIKTAVILSGYLEYYDFGELEKLRGIISNSFLIGRTEGTTSNPLTIILDYIKLIFHIDIICYNNRLRKLSESCDEICSLFVRVGRIDCAITMASLIKSMDLRICTPKFVNISEGFNIEGMYHPLNRKPVSNDICCKKGIILTGSNASGKSTFLKCCGMNTIFAQNFGFAFASSYTAPVVRLYSSMALSDNILGEESYYVVEAKSLKKICDASEKFDNIFCLVDEVLRGTNTIERISASSEILKVLGSRCICFAATHDAELTLLVEDYFDKYYFTEDIEDDKLVFRYKIHKGVAGEGNAVKLLKMLGYSSDITENAKRLAGTFKTTGKWEKI